MAIFVVLIGTATLLSSARLTAQGPTYTTILELGFNLVGWTDVPTAADDVFNALPQVTTMFTWDALSEAFSTARRDAPGFLNSLETLQPGTGVWIQVDAEAPVAWERAIGSIAAPARLYPGNNLLAWTGPGDTPVPTALASLGPSLINAFGFDAAAGRFTTFSPNLPRSLNTMTTLDYGDAVWIRTCRSASWDASRDTAPAVTLPCTAFSSNPTFEFDADLPLASASIIREGIADARTYLRLEHGIDLSAFTVRAFADLDTLIDRWVALMGESRAAAEQRWGGFAVAFGNRNSIWVSAGGAGWGFATEDQRHSAVIHEVFHVAQLQLGNSRGPQWLFEGSARYAQFVIAAAVGRDDPARRALTERDRARSTATALSSMETLAGLNAVGFTAGYSNGYVASEILSGVGDLTRIINFYRETASRAWPQAFAVAFDSTVEDFYAAYEAERALMFPPF